MRCNSCRLHVTPSPPKTVYKVLCVGFWLCSMTVAVAFSLALGLNLVLAPAAIIIGMSVGTSARRVNTWTCPHCHAELAEPVPETGALLPAPDRPVAAAPA